MATLAAAKVLTAVIDLAVSSSAASVAQRRRLMCRAAASRLVPDPPDLVRWVRLEGGFVHPNITVADRGPYGLGVVATGDIQPGSELIALPSHLPLFFERCPRNDDGGAHSTLMQLALRIPGTEVSSLTVLLRVFWYEHFYLLFFPNSVLDELLIFSLVLLARYRLMSRDVC